jgi:nicotinamide-nucleotide amidase
LFPFLKKKNEHFRNRKVLLQKTIHTIGISESLLYHKIGDINEIIKKDKDSEIKLAFLPSNFEVRLRITVEAPDINTARGLIRSTLKKLKDKAGKYIYSYDESPIEKAVGDILKDKGLKLSIAESCTGGLIASKITDVNGSANYFLEGLVCYTNLSKMKLLGVRQKTLKANGAVSRDVAIEMAEGVRKKSGSDVAISTTGIAGPTGATREKPVGLVWIGYSDSEKSFAEKFVFVKDRLRNKEMMSKTALDILRKQLTINS